MPLLPWLPQLLLQKDPCQGLAKEKKSLKKRGGEKRYTFCTQLTTTTTKKRDKTPHAKAKITIKMLTPSTST